ncbi:M15 family metallopeptidase [Heyndrickxia oleronia]|uniref:M15 family metallopeptidase n=1 Tax=Heyndrickxia oleronia TaxID=38875 RepID=A0AAW6SLY2_9BACI|nr:M15 family metallopeptidase [Heyndrickxia oleronia]MCM3236717.1 M15 family metallopeptidase [Heyndrickxia oleronia]MDH5159745.1 M15 family metallopeptidase [Heyndrickxia oleronia]
MKRIVSVAAVLLLLGGCSGGQNHEKDASKNSQQTSNHEQANAENGTKTKEKNNDLLLESKYFNQIKEVNGQKMIENTSNILSLVNKEYSIGSYVPNDLVRPKVKFSFGDQDIEKSYMRQEAATALEKMFSEAEKNGIYLFASSGYRSYERQKAILNNEIANVGKEKAEQAVATPGQSEHQTGLAMDITSESENYLLSENLGKQKEGIWLREHAHEFGFILRYPKDKENITGYEYEPWHFRYVGKKAAAVIYKNGWTLEEYFQHVEKM